MKVHILTVKNLVSRVLRQEAEDVKAMQTSRIKLRFKMRSEKLSNQTLHKEEETKHVSEWRRTLRLHWPQQTTLDTFHVITIFLTTAEANFHLCSSLESNL